MIKQKEEIRTLLNQNKTDEAIEMLNRLIESANSANNADDELYYLRGNAWRKKSNWQYALENYLEAISLNPQSPASEAHKMLMEILEFYNKDMYNQ